MNRLLLVPFYEHPADRPEAWSALVDAAPSLYGVVVNPASGAGETADPAFAEAAGRLKAAGVRLLGYVDTDYGRRPHAEVVTDLLRHRDWYGTDGAFLDQVATAPDALAHYRRVAGGGRGGARPRRAVCHRRPPRPRRRRRAPRHR
ncbi:spherulation-specific family 4 protein, partial [Streptomyces sp. NPDC058667]|uniref:spherulation-specific family 4 protein n=1 Tax=Streptomyces sp. NPDC058667 TaxID=3346588 RepID=UPI003646AF02